MMSSCRSVFTPESSSEAGSMEADPRKRDVTLVGSEVMMVLRVDCMTTKGGEEEGEKV